MPYPTASGPLISRLLDLVFPSRCAACGARGGVLCASCLGAIRAPAFQTCPTCGAPLSADPDTSSAAVRGRCPRCTAAGAGALDGILVAARYEPPIRQAILALKYQRQRRLAEPLGALLAHTAHAIAPRMSVVVPVPLHPHRQRQRGYNQAGLLARQCAARLQLPMRDDLVVRTRPTPPQVGLGAAHRRTNVAGAFAATPRATALAAGRHVLLVDDVCTTGATLTATATALLTAGASSVWGLTVARPSLDADPAPARDLRRQR